MTATTTLLTTDQVVLCNNTATTTLTLPSAATNTGRMIQIKRISTGSPGCSVTGIWATDDADGTIALATPTTASGNTLSVISDGTNWYVLDRH